VRQEQTGQGQRNRKGKDYRQERSVRKKQERNRGHDALKKK